MTIDVALFSRRGIQDAIRQLRQAKDNLRFGVQETVQILTKEGAEIAGAANGSMADVQGHLVGETTGVITSTGEANVIAEFGAGDLTLDPNGLFEENPDTLVFPGSYSLLEGSKEYFLTGRWHFGGKEFTFVEPRQGMFKAKEHIINNGVEIAREVIEL